MAIIRKYVCKYCHLGWSGPATRLPPRQKCICRKPHGYCSWTRVALR